MTIAALTTELLPEFWTTNDTPCALLKASREILLLPVTLPEESLFAAIPFSTATPSVSAEKVVSAAPRLPRSELERSVSPMMLSFMSESRRLHNARIKEELGVRLRYPEVQSLLAQWREQRLTKG